MKNHTSTNEVSACSITEVMKYSIAMVLQHLCMNIEARIAKLCNLLGQQFHSIHRVAENDGLVDLKLEICTCL